MTPMPTYDLRWTRFTCIHDKQHDRLLVVDRAQRLGGLGKMWPETRPSLHIPFDWIGFVSARSAKMEGSMTSTSTPSAVRIQYEGTTYEHTCPAWTDDSSW